MAYEVDFLPVGDGEKSGDAIVLRIGNFNINPSEQKVIVIDAGFQDTGVKVVEHIQNYYGTDKVNLVISTHPDSDHIGGLCVVLESLRVGELWLHQPWNHTDDIAKMFVDGRVTDNSIKESMRKSLNAARCLEAIAHRKNIPIKNPFTGLTYSSIYGKLTVLGPSVEFYENLLSEFRCAPEPKQGVNVFESFFKKAEEVIKWIAEAWDCETLTDDGETTAENNSSAIMLLSVDGKNLLFTADAGQPALTEVLDLLESTNFDFSTLSFVQVPHHGSERNIGPTILNRLLGHKQTSDTFLRSALVSVAKEANHKHPSKKVMNAFRRRGAPVHITKGDSKLHHNNGNLRNWGSSAPLPFYDRVEE